MESANHTVYNMFKVATQCPSPYTHRIQWECYEEHSHTFWECVLIVKGEAHHFCNETEEIIRSGQLMFVRPTDVHHYKIDGVNKYGLFPEGAEKTYLQRDIYIQTETLDSAADFMKCRDLVDFLLKTPVPYTINLTTSQSEALQLKLNILEMYNKDEKSRFDSIHKSLVCDLLELALEYKTMSTQHYPDWLNDLLSKMRNIDIMRGTLDDIVKISGFSHGHLCRMFKKYTGKRLLDSFLQLKMQYAADLLTNYPNLSVLEIAGQVGYDAQSNFNNQFKKYYGITPSSYRKKYWSEKGKNIHETPLWTIESER